MYWTMIQEQLILRSCWMIKRSFNYKIKAVLKRNRCLLFSWKGFETVTFRFYKVRLIKFMLMVINLKPDHKERAFTLIWFYLICIWKFYIIWHFEKNYIIRHFSKPRLIIFSQCFLFFICLNRTSKNGIGCQLFLW